MDTILKRCAMKARSSDSFNPTSRRLKLDADVRVTSDEVIASGTVWTKGDILARAVDGAELAKRAHTGKRASRLRCTAEHLRPRTDGGDARY
jgi:hypothetical protein